MLVQRTPSRFGVNVQEERDETVRGFYGTGIDDLAKYRIVQYLQQSSGPCDVFSISASLGLHPVDLVAEAVESLEDCGTLVRTGQNPPVYALSCHPSLRSALDRLYSPVSSQERECIFRSLAASSLAKARARARGNAAEVKE